MLMLTAMREHKIGGVQLTGGWWTETCRRVALVVAKPLGHETAVTSDRKFQSRRIYCVRDFHLAFVVLPCLCYYTYKRRKASHENNDIQWNIFWVRTNSLTKVQIKQLELTSCRDILFLHFNERNPRISLELGV